MGRNAKHDADRVSIEELAATLESKIGVDVHERADDEDLALEERASPAAARQAAAPPPPPILVAHADPGVRGAVRAALERHFQVLEADDGEGAWETLASHRDIRLLLTGTGLPRLEGIELIRRLRRPNGPSHLVGLPVMLYAEREDANVKQTALLAGANDYLTQDIEPATLLTRVQARNRLFEQSRRAMNLTGTMPTARAGRPEASNGASARSSASPAPPRPQRQETPARRPGERPIWVEARGGGRPAVAGPRGWAERLYRISSTTTITLTATVLVILAITLILLLNQTPQRPKSLAVGRLDTAPPAERTSEPRTALSESVDRAESPPTPTSANGNTTAPEPVPDDPPATAPPVASGPPPAISKPGGGRKEAAVAGSRTESGRPNEERRPPVTEAPAPSKPSSADVASRPRNPVESASPAAAGTAGREEPPKPSARASPAPKTDEPEPVTRDAQPAPTAETRPSPPRAATPPPAAKPESSSAAEVPTMSDRPANTSVAAAATPAPPSPPPRPASARLSREELTTLLQRFVSVYEAGDIEQFMALLADNVQTNDRITRQAVREDYDRLFRTTDLRQMRVDSMNWDVEGEQAHGWGEFEVEVRRQGDASVYHYEGSLTLLVRKADGRPRIERLYHSERRASR